MIGFERKAVLWAIVYMVVYFPFFLLFGFLSDSRQNWISISEEARWIFFMILIPFHFLGMAQNLLALILTLRDLYKRPFPQTNQKLTWCILILTTGGIGWLVYVFKYALKPRPTSEIAQTVAI